MNFYVFFADIGNISNQHTGSTHYMRAKGKITSWNDEKGFGFITPLDGGKQIFVHIKAFNSRKRPSLNQVVTYTESTDKRGRPRAEEVTRAGEVLFKDRKQSKNAYAFLIAIIFITIVSLSVLSNTIPFVILAYYLMVSIITFCWYWKDKSAAQRDDWRTPESTLHLLSLIGGWPGGLIAQQVLRHKSKKQSFRTVFWITVLLNCGVFIWFHTPEGGMILNSFVS